MRVAQAGGQDVLGPFVVTGNQGDLRPEQFEGWEFMPTLNLGVGGNFMVPFASFLTPLTGGIGGAGQSYGLFLDFSRGTIGFYDQSNVRIGFGAFAGVNYEFGLSTSSGFSGEGSSGFFEVGRGRSVGGTTGVPSSFGPSSLGWSRGQGYGATVGWQFSNTKILGEVPLF